MAKEKDIGDAIEGIDYAEIVSAFVAIVLKSPVAIITIVLSWFLGYGISFVLFDYRKQQAEKSHFYFHCVIGLGYSALIFVLVNWDIISTNITMEDISKRIPLTLLISFSIGFVLIIGGVIYRQRSPA